MRGPGFRAGATVPWETWGSLTASVRGVTAVRSADSPDLQIHSVVAGILKVLVGADMYKLSELLHLQLNNYFQAGPQGSFLAKRGVGPSLRLLCPFSCCLHVG